MKTNLIKSLKIAVSALEADRIEYDWSLQCSCNCGVVAQAILQKDKSEIETAFVNMMEKTGKIIEDSKSTYKFRTWKDNVKYHCSITGESNIKILNDLKEAGLSAEDICHLEYLENPAILKRANIYVTEIIKTKVKVGERNIQVPVNTWVRASGIKGLLGKKILHTNYEKQTEEIFEIKTETKQVLEKHYYKNRKNLIKYLKAWIQIIEEDKKTINSNLTKDELREELLKAESKQEFEYCVELRDLIAAK